MIPCLNKNFSTDKMNMQNIVRKFLKVKNKVNNLPEIAQKAAIQEVLVKPSNEWAKLNSWFDAEKLSNGKIEERQPRSVFTTEMFLELGQYKFKTGNITWCDVSKWFAEKFERKTRPSKQYLSHDFHQARKEFLSTVRDKKRRQFSLSREYYPPFPEEMKKTSEGKNVNIQSNCSLTSEPSTSADVSQKHSKIPKEIAVELYESYAQITELNILVMKHTAEIEEITNKHETVETDQHKKLNSLEHKLSALNKQYKVLQNKLQVKTEELSHYCPRNVGKRERRRDKNIENLEKETSELETITEDLGEYIELLESRLGETTQKSTLLQR